jgi:hypothetical protein
LDENGIALDVGVSVGDQVLGVIAYDLDSRDSRPHDPKYAGYVLRRLDVYFPRTGVHSSLDPTITSGISVQINEAPLFFPPSHLFSAENPGVFTGLRFVPDVPPIVEFSLRDNSSTIFPNDSLPETLNLADFDEPLFGIFSPPQEPRGEEFGIGANIISLRQVPEPSSRTISIIGIGILVVVVLRHSTTGIERTVCPTK